MVHVNNLFMDDTIIFIQEDYENPYVETKEAVFQSVVSLSTIVPSEVAAINDLSSESALHNSVPTIVSSRILYYN